MWRSRQEEKGIIGNLPRGKNKSSGNILTKEKRGLDEYLRRGGGGGWGKKTRRSIGFTRRKDYTID